MRSPGLAVTVSQSQMVSDTATTLPWLASMDTGSVPVHSEGAATGVSGHSPERVLKAPGTTAATLGRDVKTPMLPDDPEAGTGTLLMAHSSAPKQP